MNNEYKKLVRCVREDYKTRRQKTTEIEPDRGRRE
jgi:hypothetical protein